MSTDDKSAADQLVELLVYAPVGLLYEYENVFKQVVTRGRSQVQLAKVMGKMASQRGSGDIEENLSQAVGGVAATLARGITEFGVAVGLAPPSEPDVAATEVQPTEAPAPAAGTTPTSPTPTKAPTKPAAGKPLPIAGYDDLRAKEIVVLLGDLGAGQLARVASYENATRGRKTILARIDRLTASEDS
ncbi:MAG: hypothetical protein ACI8TP_003569 [Acidimicrobiales bacterium]|jgi:hypothetical protein